MPVVAGYLENEEVLKGMVGRKEGNEESGGGGGGERTEKKRKMGN